MSGIDLFVRQIFEMATDAFQANGEKQVWKRLVENLAQRKGTLRL
jgi:hypothetical protein